MSERKESFLYRSCTNFNIDFEKYPNEVEKPIILLENEFFGEGADQSVSLNYYVAHNSGDSFSERQQTKDSFYRKYKSFIDFLFYYAEELKSIKIILLEEKDYVYATGRNSNGAAYFQLENIFILNITQLLQYESDYWRHVIVHEKEHVNQHNSLSCNQSRFNNQTLSMLYESNAEYVATKDEEYLRLRQLSLNPVSRRMGIDQIFEENSAKEFLFDHFEQNGIDCGINCDPYSLAGVWNYIGTFDQVVATKARDGDFRTENSTEFLSKNEYLGMSVGRLLGLVTWGTLYSDDETMKNINKYIGFNYNGKYPYMLTSEDVFTETRSSVRFSAANFEVDSGVVQKMINLKKLKFILKAEAPLFVSDRSFDVEVNIVDLSSLAIIDSFELKDNDFIGDIFEIDLSGKNLEAIAGSNLGFSIYNSTGEHLYISLAAAQYVEDCNLDGQADDLAEINEFGGIISLTATVAEEAFIANGARICGNSVVSGENTYISGSRIVMQDSNINNACSHVFIEANGLPVVNAQDYYKSNFVYISNSDLCSGGSDNRGVVISSNTVDARVEISNSVIASAANLDETNVIDSDIMGTGFNNAMNSYLYNSMLSGANYISESVLNGVNVYAPSNPFVMNDGFELVNSFQGTALYNVIDGRKNISGYNLIQGPVISEVSISAGLPLAERVGGYIVLNQLRANMSKTTVSGVQAIGMNVDESNLSGDSSANYRSQVNAPLWRVNASGYYLINHPIDRTSLRDQKTTSSFKPYVFEPWGP